MLGNGSPVLLSRDRSQKGREASFSLPVLFGVGTGSGEDEHLSGASNMTPDRFLVLLVAFTGIEPIAFLATAPTIGPIDMLPEAGRKLPFNGRLPTQCSIANMRV